MNQVSELLDTLRKKDVRLGLNADGDLRVQGEKNQLNDGLIAGLRKHKAALIAVLKANLPFGLLTDDERSQLGNGYEDAYPMSALQAGMVFHTQLEQFSGVYHDIMAEHVRCPWERGCFEQALAGCIDEQPILRTGFRLDGERPLQHVHRRIELPLEVEDLRGWREEEQERHLGEWRERRKRHAFDWQRGPLFQISIFLRTEESFE